MANLGRRPVLAALLGACCIAFSGPLVRLADVPPSSAALYRCLLAVPVLALLASREDRALGRLPTSTRWTAVLAGAFFACDLVLWHHTIDAVGAGLATVLGNLQVLVVAVVAWWLLGERPHAGLATVLGNLQVLVVAVVAWWLLGERPHAGLVAAVPVLLLGVTLVSGGAGR